ncbi:MAG: hypothetical protein IPM69_05425 [Ignavibacteria bacterium]|nr:hypothetical protein [Ignavibacteria bacterium]
MKNVFFVCALYLSIVSISKAQDTVQFRSIKPIEYNHKLGFAGSMFSGYGISYEYKASKDITLEFTGSIYGSGGSNDNNSTYDYSNSYLVAVIGAEFQRNFFASNDSRFYGLIGVGLWIDNTDYSYNYSYSNKTDYSGGVGLGWEFTFGKRIIFNVEGGYLYRYMNTTGTYDYSSGNRAVVTTKHNYYLGFGGGLGLYYAF